MRSLSVPLSCAAAFVVATVSLIISILCSIRVPFDETELRVRKLILLSNDGTERARFELLGNMPILTLRHPDLPVETRILPRGIEIWGVEDRPRAHLVVVDKDSLLGLTSEAESHVTLGALQELGYLSISRAEVEYVELAAKPSVTKVSLRDPSGFLAFHIQAGLDELEALRTFLEAGEPAVGIEVVNNTPAIKLQARDGRHLGALPE